MANQSTSLPNNCVQIIKLYQRSLILTHFMGPNRLVRAGAARSAMSPHRTSAAQRPLGTRRADLPHLRPGRFLPPEAAPLVVYHLANGSIASWLDDIVIGALSLSRLDFMGAEASWCCAA